LLIVEEVFLKSLGRSIKILIFDETSEQWSILRTLGRVVSSRDDIALKAYAALLQEGKKLEGRRIATLVDKPRYSVNRGLKNLMELDLVERESKPRGRIEFNLWYPKEQVSGLLRLIPEEYFKE
jgi:predicted transcriptional regulator